MTLNVGKMKAGNFKKKDLGRLPDGPVHARIVSVVDFGLQPQTDWQTKEPKDPKKTVMITFETPEEKVEIEDKEGNKIPKPRWISKEYTQSMHEKSALFKLISTVAPDIEGLEELLNIPVLVTVGSTSTGNAKVANVSTPMKGFTVPDLENETVYFDFDEPDMTLFEALPQWQQNKIKEALDYNGFADEGPDAAPEEDEF